MSEKEYEITKIGDGKYEVKEKQDYSWDPEYKAKTKMTIREKIGYKMLNIPKWAKILLVSLGNLYGILYRYGSNRGRAVAFSILQFFYLVVTIVFTVGLVLVSFGRLPSSSEDIIIFYITLPYYIFWLIDLLSVIFADRILFIGRKIYKDYKG